MADGGKENDNGAGDLNTAMEILLYATINPWRNVVYNSGFLRESIFDSWRNVVNL